MQAPLTDLTTSNPKGLLIQGRQQNHEYQRLTRRDVLQFLSSLIIPLVLATFTIVTTFHQQKAIREQRLEDLENARDQNKQQQLHERELAQKEYSNELLTSYIKDIASLLKENNGSLTNDSTISIIARVKTLNVIRQLSNTEDQAHVIRFLHEAGQLNATKKQNSLDLSSAKLTGFNFRDVAVDEKHLKHFSLTNVILTNASFENLQMEDIDLTSTHFRTTNFLNGHLKNVKFSSANFTNATFSSAILNEINFSRNKMTDIYFSKSSVVRANFSSSSILRTEFIDAKLFNVDLSSIQQLEKSDFSHALLDSVDFFNSKLQTINFSNSRLANIKISSAELENVNFASAKMAYIDFSESYLKNSNFSSAILVSARFSSAELIGTDFRQTTCTSAVFDDAKFTNSNFSNSNLKHASFKNVDLTNVVLTDANLYSADFSGGNITDSQLLSALSIQNAILPNGTRAHDRNLIKNGDADCQMNASENWKILPFSTDIDVIEAEEGNCLFVLKSSHTKANMSQRVYLSDNWKLIAWPHSLAVLNANMSKSVSISVTAIKSTNHTVVQQTLLESDENISLILDADMLALEINVMFNLNDNPISDTTLWCDYVKLFVIYGTYSENLRVVPNIPADAHWEQEGTIVAGRNEIGNATDHLSGPCGIFIDDDDKQTIIIADSLNHRIVEWRQGSNIRKVVAGGQGCGNCTKQLDRPYDVLVDKQTNSFLICDHGNRRVVQWSRLDQTGHGKILISNISCWGLFLDEKRNLYVSDHTEHVVKRYQIDRGDTIGTTVAGGNKHGVGLHQLSEPTNLFVDQQQTLYVSDSANNRIMKWKKDAKEGIIVAGRLEKTKTSIPLSSPNGIYVDMLHNTIYVAEGSFQGNQRVTRWSSNGETKSGTTIIGGNGPENLGYKFDVPMGLSFDRYGNLYVVDNGNHVVVRFDRI